MTAATAVVGYTLRACLPPKRRLGLLALAVVTVAFGALARGSDDPATVAVVEVTGAAFFGLVLPIAALVVGDAALGAEIRSGVFSFTWLSPVGLGTVVVGRWAAASAVLCAVLVPAAVVATGIGGAPDAAGAFAAATVLGALGYCAVFMAIGATFRRSAAVSLVYVLLVERLLGAGLSAIAQLAPGWLARAVLTGGVDGLPDRLVRDGVPAGGGAAARLAMVTVVALALAVRGLRRLTVTGASD